MNECIICGKQGEKHHIVYKNQGGLDIEINYIFLCNYHHRSEEGPHKNREVDLKYKKMLQNKLLNILKKDYYDIREVEQILKINPIQGKLISRQINKYKLGYKKMDIIKRIMGRKLY